MKRYATTLLVLAGLLCTAGLARAQDAQDVTVRQIKEVPQENLDELEALGASLTPADISRLGRSDLMDQKVRFTAVVLAEPSYSGLASLNAQGQPGRVHFFVRDTAAVSLGIEGMDIQIVSGYPAFRDQGVIGLFKGDVITVTGEVDYFNEVNVQIAPESIEYIGTIETFGLPASILDPLTITTADAVKNMGEARIQFNWANFNDLNQQFVRIEDATVFRSEDPGTGRLNWAVTSDGAQTVVMSDDVSLCFRNDKKDYPGDFNECKDVDFARPAPGAQVNVQGFLTIRGNFDPFAIGAPPESIARIVPWEAADFEVTEQPSITNVAIAPLTAAPDDGPIPVSVSVVGDLSAVTRVRLFYQAGASPEQSIDLAAQGDGTFTGEIPAQADGTFVTYRAEVLDRNGSTYQTISPSTTRVLFEGINEIADIQQTATGGAGSSPFRNLTTPMNIVATVQTDPGTSGIIAIQDDASLAPWTGIQIRPTEALRNDLHRGDVIHITAGQIEESFDLTQLRDITYMQMPTTGQPLGYKTLTTDVLQDRAVAEAYESMLVRFETPTITNVNPDAPSDFDEWAFSTDGTEANQVRADDASSAVGPEVHDGFNVGDQLEFIQGVWTYTFNNYKLLPETMADIGAIIVANEDETVPGAFALSQNYPNPFNPATTIKYQIGTTGRVTLEVVDLLGRTVATLVDGHQATGAYEVQFDGRTLASGLYVYRLTAGGQTLTKKMMLLK